MSEVSIDFGALTLSSLEANVNELEEQIKATRQAQSTLCSSADSLAEYLHQFNEMEPVFDLLSYSNRLGDVGRRMKGVDQTLISVHDRLSVLQRQIAREIYKQKQRIGQLSPEAIVPPIPEH